MVNREDSPCPYFDDNRVSTIEFLIDEELDRQSFGRLLAQGFRRTGPAFYRTACDGCASCIPLRIETERFTPSRSQRRTARKNSDITVDLANPLPLSEEKIRLYAAYLAGKHASQEGRQPEDILRSLAMIHAGYRHAIEMDYYLDGKLVGVGIVDEADDALSANYFYYDTSLLGRRPGVFSVLEEIRLARFLKKRYYYLGFFLEETRKMSYKKFFRPNQILRGGAWQAFQNDIQE